jgi:hypothetical protein
MAIIKTQLRIDMQRLDLVCSELREALHIAVDKKIKFVMGNSRDDRFSNGKTLARIEKVTECSDRNKKILRNRW